MKKQIALIMLFAVVVFAADIETGNNVTPFMRLPGTGWDGITFYPSGPIALTIDLSQCKSLTSIDDFYVGSGGDLVTQNVIGHDLKKLISVMFMNSFELRSVDLSGCTNVEYFSINSGHILSLDITPFASRLTAFDLNAVIGTITNLIGFSGITYNGIQILLMQDEIETNALSRLLIDLDSCPVTVGTLDVSAQSSAPSVEGMSALTNMVAEGWTIWYYW